MTTIAQTLLDIESLQKDIDDRLGREELQPDPFIDDIIRITQAYQFDLLAHSSLDTVKAELADTSNFLVLNYYTLSDQADIHKEYIRLLNIGGLFMAWNIFENFIRKTYARMFDGSDVNRLQDAYKDILQKHQIDDRTAGRMIGEFNVIRFVRSVLYQGGVYLNPNTRKFGIAGETYTLEKGKPVKPIRLMTVISVIWNHYLAIVS